MLTPHLGTKRTTLVAADATDGTSVYELLIRLGQHSLPALETFLERYDDDVEALFVVQTRHNGERVGFCTLHRLDAAGHVQIGIFLNTEKARFGIGGEVMMLLVNYAFATWDHVRKLYFLTTEATLDRFGPALASVTKEATLPQHRYFGGELWDVHWYAIHREVWEVEGADVLERLVQGPMTRPLVDAR